ncbi:MAG: hypothetical protein ACREV8_01045 [Gammaproteobacteria bacterium]
MSRLEGYFRRVGRAQDLEQRTMQSERPLRLASWEAKAGLILLQDAMQIGLDLRRAFAQDLR